MNRRTFISTSIAATLSASQPSWAIDSAHKLNRLGLQLYTVRKQMQKDFAGVIAKVAATGYNEVEFAGLFDADGGYFGHAPKDVRAILDNHGLAAPSCHAGYGVVEKRLSEALEAAHVVGHRYLICPWIEEKQRAEPDGWKRASDLFNHAGETCKKAGIQFGYHNHAFEFDSAESLGGKAPYDFFLEQLDPKLVIMELDLCWTTVAGKDPVAYFDKYPGRFPLVHVKDWLKDGSATAYAKESGLSAKSGGRMTGVGQGSVDWKRIFAHSETAGIKHYFVENDDPKSPFEDIKTSYDHLHNLRY